LIWTLLEHDASVSIIEHCIYHYRDHEGDRLTLSDPVQMTENLKKILRVERSWEQLLLDSLIIKQHVLSRTADSGMMAVGIWNTQRQRPWGRPMPKDSLESLP
jgi:hypothetical protein